MLTVNDLLLLNGQLAAYKPADQDVSSPMYDGFVSADGAWYIMKTTTTGNVRSYRFVKAESGYAAAWTARATKTYDYFSVVFPH